MWRSRERDKDARFCFDLPFRFGERKEGTVVFDGKGEAARAMVEDLEPLGLNALFIEREAGRSALLLLVPYDDTHLRFPNGERGLCVRIETRCGRRKGFGR